MSDLSKPSAAPSASPLSKETISADINKATHSVGERIGETTAGVEIANETQESSARQGNPAQKSGTTGKRHVIPTTEEKLRSDMEEYAEEQIEDIREDLEMIAKKGGKGLAYNYSEKVREIRKLRTTIISLYEMTIEKLTEMYKTIFRIAP